MDMEEFEEEGFCPHYDFDDYFNRVNIRNNRLKRLIKHKAPQVIIDAEKRMLREAVDVLLNYLDKKEKIVNTSVPFKNCSDVCSVGDGEIVSVLLAVWLQVDECTMDNNVKNWKQAQYNIKGKEYDPIKRKKIGMLLSNTWTIQIR